MKTKMLTSKDFRVTPIKADDLKNVTEVIVTADGGSGESYCTAYRYNQNDGKVYVSDFTNIIKDIDFKNETIDIVSQPEHNFRIMTVADAVKQINQSIALHDEEQFGGTFITVRLNSSATREYMRGYKVRSPKKKCKTTTMKKLATAYKRMI